jgi:hypothetical protein
MLNNSHRIVVAAISLTLAFTRFAAAEDCCCSHCGCNSQCHKVCRLVCEEKKVDVICWGCKCEYFCLPRCSKPNWQHCEEVCSDCEEPCDCTKPDAAAKRFVWTDWIPGCATVHKRTKLMQKIVTKKVPSYKWVVEDLCPTCEASVKSAAVEPGVTVPAPLLDDAKLVYAEVAPTSPAAP